MNVRAPRCWPPLRVVLLALYLVQTIASGPIIAHMAIAQSAAPGQQIVICTPEGLKKIDWPGPPGESVPNQDLCACPCGVSCSSCTKLTAGNGIASPVLYPARRIRPVRRSGARRFTQHMLDLSSGSSRSPPAFSIS
ncbi:MAG: hypothetical protein ACTSP0_06670 [Alphaproteobacteria bacterium]